MFKCTGNCDACRKCYNIFPHQVEKDMIFPSGFLGSLNETAKNTLENISENTNNEKDKFGIAFDIGTTTVAAVLWNLSANRKVSTIGGENPQRNFGADVISRIAYCQGSEEKREKLRIPLMKTFEKMVLTLVNENNISLDQLKRCVFCGNTTMTLIFAGQSTDGLACFPFYPERTLEMKYEFNVEDHIIPSVILPGISGHIGGDITGTMLAAGMDETLENSMLLDLGTNGEVICNIHGSLYGFSTAAGPAFEGANISCGMAATVGAINEFSMNENSCSYTLIDDIDGKSSKEVLGVCGTGLMSVIENMLAQKIINVHGDLCSWDDYKRMYPYNSLGDRISHEKFVLVPENINEGQREISITQYDIRQLQMAKAAILAGIKTLFKTVSVNPMEIKKVYLAGGFSKISPDILNSLNIFPFDITDKLLCIGNGALTGASMVLLSSEMREKAKGFSEKVNRIELGSSPYFQEEFMKSFDFRKI